MDNWTIRRFMVVEAGNAGSWGVYVDGCAQGVVVPKIYDCLKALRINARDIHRGLASPFFTVLEDLSGAGLSRADMQAFSEAFGERVINGPYCDSSSVSQFMQTHHRARILSWTRSGGRFEVKIAASGPRALNRAQHARQACEAVNLAPNRESATLIIKAHDRDDLAAQLRLIGNMLLIRWEHRCEFTSELLGSPLL